MHSKTVPFVRGFRVPTQNDIDNALGDNATFSDEFKRSFDPLPKPTCDLDWLAQFKEIGQTYSQFLDECPLLDTDDADNQIRKCLYLTVMDSDSECSSLLNIDHLLDYTQRFFQMEVKLLPVFTKVYWNEKRHTWMCTIKSRRNSTKEITLTTRYDSTSGHSQICVKSVLDILNPCIPSDAYCLVAVTLHDFYCTQSDLFIAGLARGNNRIAAFSFFRYDPRLTFGEEFWHDWTLRGSKSKSVLKLILLRSCRLLTHEIGHLLGLDHCIYYSCLMNGSGHLKEDFSQPLFLCPIDLRKLSQLATFDFIKRYEQLLELCTENRFQDEANSLNKRIQILKKGRQVMQTKRKKEDSGNKQIRCSKRLKKL